MKTSEEQIREFEELFCALKATLHLPDEVIIRLYNKFFESVSSTLLQLNEAIEAQDYGSIEMHAHSIKGASGSLYYTVISEIAHMMEKNAHEKEECSYTEMFEELKNEVDLAQHGYMLWTNKS